MDSKAKALPAISTAQFSEIGARSYNEDRLGLLNDGRHLCAVVADGAGGHGGGDIAAHVAVDTLLRRAGAAPPDSAEQVRSLILAANERVIERRAHGVRERNMFTTVVALFLDLAEQQAWWGHAGDSRLYAFRRGILHERTLDHSVVQGLADAGLIRPEDMAQHPRRHQLESALGSPPQELRVNCRPEPWSLAAGDAFLLCSDGVWDSLEESELVESLSEALTVEAWLAAIRARIAARARREPQGAQDNFTALGLWIGDAARLT